MFHFQPLLEYNSVRISNVTASFALKQNMYNDLVEDSE